MTISGFTLDDVRQVIRNVTGDSGATAAFLDPFINKFYAFVLPDDMKPISLLVDYRFNTLANQNTYFFDQNTYVSLEPEFFCNGNRLFYYQDQSIWLRDYQYQYNQSQVATGDGSQTNFPGSIDGPVVPGSVIYTDGVEVFSDPGAFSNDPSATLTGSLGGTGTFVYATGTYSITFATPPPDGNAILQTYAPVINGRPRAMYYDGNGHIQFSPIPDQSYLIEGRAYIMPTAIIEGGSGLQTFLVNYWGYVIAYGASLEIFRQRGQIDQLNVYRPEYEKYLDLALSRSTQQYSNQRTLPKW